ncbi:hypothetical protein F5B19DRAFT_295924 [Rostrohypoxylon terebratum]|nr:hypothetical protein F5B19DRAFT_295924 [Rostrohypoxylon terebratum]
MNVHGTRTYSTHVFITYLPTVFSRSSNSGVSDYFHGRFARDLLFLAYSLGEKSKRKETNKRILETWERGKVCGSTQLFAIFVFSQRCFSSDFPTKRVFFAQGAIDTTKLSNRETRKGQPGGQIEIMHHRLARLFAPYPSSMSSRKHTEKPKAKKKSPKHTHNSLRRLSSSPTRREKYGAEKVKNETGRLAYACEAASVLLAR